MDTATDPASAVTCCSWCGLAMSSDAHFCPSCKAPNRAAGYVLFGLNFFARNFLLPMAIGLLTFMLSTKHEDSERAIAAQQQESARAIAVHEKLVDAYGEFARAHSDYRVAENTIAYIAMNDETDVKFQTLTEAILQLDKAFDSIGTKLTPFEEFEKQQPHFKSQYASGRTKLEETWQDCFVQPYFSNDPTIGQNYQQAITSQLQQCKGGVCSREVVRGVKRILDKIDLGRCTGALPPGTSHTFDWLWTELARIMRPVDASTAPPQTTMAH